VGVREPGAGPPLSSASNSRTCADRVRARRPARVEEGDDLAEVAIRVARERGTTYVLMGAPSPRRGLSRLAEPVPQRIVRALPEVDVRLVAERSASG